ncbi:MAG: type II toxin-antitoxin system RelE/ParE family toxin [Selenomonadaceae bacterium]|nr:type II toxin-antitoxin system RelE/ParE family toxin [Selenomonadaceae bacterium]
MNVIFTEKFKNDLKYYIRKKKYKNILVDIKSVVNELEQGHLVGDELEDINVEGRTFKVRVANSSANVGKSNGFRIIYYVVQDDNAYLLTIYSKKDDVKIPSDNEVKDLINRSID